MGAYRGVLSCAESRFLFSWLDYRLILDIITSTVFIFVKYLHNMA